MEIFSPKHGFVTSLAVSHGQAVNAGAAIIVVDVDTEERDTARVQTLRKLVDAYAFKVSDEYIAVKRDAVLASIDIAQKALDVSSAAFAEADALVAVGVLKPIERTRREGEKFEAEKRLGIEQGKLIEFDLATAAQKSMHTILIEHIAIEEQYLVDSKEKMTLVTPIDGTISYRVAVGSFAKRGSILADVE